VTSAPDSSFSPPAANDPAGLRNETGRPWLLAAAGILAALWIAALALLAALTANPPQLNLAQLARARFVVIADAIDPPHGTCRLVEPLTPGSLPERFIVSNLARSGARPGRRYLLPLQVDPIAAEPAFRIVHDPASGLPPLAYEDGPDVRRQWAAWQQPGR